jgi:formate dehydrogenase assembly factor FdhD
VSGTLTVTSASSSGALTVSSASSSGILTVSAVSNQTFTVSNTSETLTITN